jgi:glycosyltransferase involved in cell wall biosynthesis
MLRATFLAASERGKVMQRLTSEFSSKVACQLIVAEPETPNSARIPRYARRIFGGRRLRKTVAQFEPDVVYSDSPLHAARLLPLLTLRRIPLILYMRGDWWREYNAWFATAPLKKRVFWIPQYAYASVALRKASKIAPTSRWLEGVVHCYLPKKRTEVVYPGLDPAEFFPEKGLEFGKPAVAIVQNHTVYPKVEGLLRFRGVVERMPKVNFYIATGERTNQPYLPLVRRCYDGVPNVHFVSGVRGLDGFRRVLTAADCYVLASGLDSLGASILEASLMRRPVLASRVGGIPETIVEGETGWTIRNDDLDEWVRKIDRVLSDPELSRCLGEKGRQWVSERFGWKAIAAQVEQILLEEARLRG